LRLVTSAPDVASLELYANNLELAVRRGDVQIDAVFKDRVRVARVECWS
jgi:hypothetical protein